MPTWGRSHQSSLNTESKCVESTVTATKRRQEALEEAAVTVVQLFDPQQKICVILDRVDRCERTEQMHLLPILAKPTTAAS